MRYRVFSFHSRLTAAILLGAFLLSTLAAGSICAAANTALRKLPIYCTETNEKKIAVTFDAAWSADDTDTLLAILKKYDAKATVFAVGSWVQQNPSAVKKFFDAGHELANHSDTHPSFSKASRSTVTSEIRACNERIFAVTGKAPVLVRAPSGDYDNKSIECTEALGMKMIQWSVDSLDWKGLSVDEMVARVISKTQNGSILLFHNGVKNTPAALEQILQKLSEKGYSFVTVSELLCKGEYMIDRTGKQLPKTSS